MSSPLPISPMLSEATPDSLSDLMSRDPEGYSTQDLDRIIQALREQRARQQATAALPKPRASSSKATVQLPSLDPSELGI